MALSSMCFLATLSFFLVLVCSGALFVFRDIGWGWVKKNCPFFLPRNYLLVSYQDHVLLQCRMKEPLKHSLASVNEIWMGVHT